MNYRFLTYDDLDWEVDGLSPRQQKQELIRYFSSSARIERQWWRNTRVTRRARVRADQYKGPAARLRLYDRHNKRAIRKGFIPDFHKLNYANTCKPSG